MNPKIEKLRGELQKNKSRIVDLQNKNRELDKQIRELENTDTATFKCCKNTRNGAVNGT